MQKHMITSYSFCRSYGTTTLPSSLPSPLPSFNHTFSQNDERLLSGHLTAPV